VVKEEKETDKENVPVDVVADVGVVEEKGRGSLRGIKRLRERSVEPRACVVR